MRYVMMTFVGPEHAEAWRRATPEDRQARSTGRSPGSDQGAAIVGGEELDRTAPGPCAARRDRRPVHRDQGAARRVHRPRRPGRGGALAIAGGWPGLDWAATPSRSADRRRAGRGDRPRLTPHSIERIASRDAVGERRRFGRWPARGVVWTESSSSRRSAGTVMRSRSSRPRRRPAVRHRPGHAA